MPRIPFVKATACGNDFLIIAASAFSGDLHALTRTICDRRNGVGADGVEWTMPSDTADLRVKLVNADGSDAEISGNGTRCVAAWYCSEHASSETVRIETDAGVKICELRSREGNRFEFRTTMGEPKVYGELAVGLNYDEVKGIPVSMGNPHYVIFVDEFPPQWQDMAAEVATHRDFPNGTNVELARVVNEHKLEVRIWERGVGETLSSGTGSSASAVAAIASGRAQSPVSVHTPGGTQTVEWNSEVFLTGPATLLCRGEFFS
jgi:diaminopimelate epimerase